MKIFVMRHGLTEMNKAGQINAEVDEPLAPEGRQQAMDAVLRVPKTVRHIYTSPQLRARQTADIVAAHLSLPVTPHTNLAEVKMGSLAGKAWTDMPSDNLQELHRAVQFDYKPYGGDSVVDVTQRLTELTEMLATEHGDDEVLIVTHGGIIRVLRFMEDGFVSQDNIGNTAIFELDTTRILANGL